MEQSRENFDKLSSGIEHAKEGDERVNRDIKKAPLFTLDYGDKFGEWRQKMYRRMDGIS